MARVLKKYNPLVLGVLLVSLLVAMIVFGTIGKNAEAAVEPVWDEDELIIAHITDTHFYPIRMLYKGEDLDIHKSQLLDRKITSEASLWAHLAGIKEMNPLPHYLFVTGDISHNGERRSLVDIANALRGLQEEIRKVEGRENFQVFVIPGNHDLHNAGTYNYSTGVGVKIPNVTRKEFSKVFAGLGYPDISEEEAESFYTTAEYNGDYSEVSYIHSTTAENLEMKWCFDSNRERTDYELGELTYFAKPTDRDVTFIGMDVVMSNRDKGHVTGGTFYDIARAFMDENKEDFLSEYFVGLAHHSVVEHMEYQEEYITDFVLRDWINVADYFADYGMRYVFTGHVHSCDISHRVSFNLNQITDIQTSAALEYAGMVRLATVRNGFLEETKIQDLYIQNVLLQDVDITFAYDEGYIRDDVVDILKLREFFDTKTGEGKKKTIHEFQRFRNSIFLDGIFDMVYEFLRPSVIGTLKQLLKDVVVKIPGIGSGLKDSPLIVELVDVLVERINEDILGNYVYKGTDPELEENKLFGYANDLVDKILDFDIGGEITLVDYVLYIYTGYIGGSEVGSAEEIPKVYADVTNNLRSGEYVKNLFDIILDKEEGVYFLISSLMNTPLDLTEVTGLDDLLKYLVGPMIGYEREALSAKDLVLGDVLMNVLKSDALSSFGLDLGFELTGHDSAMGLLDMVLDDYLTQSFYQGLGEILANVIEAFYIDPTFDGTEIKTKILLDARDSYTYSSVPREDEPTIENGKIASKLTVTFGGETSTEKNFSWFTDRRVEEGVIQYMEKSKGAFDSTKATVKKGDTVIYGTTKGLIDLGLFATLGYTERARHTVELSALTSNTEYWYRVGWPERGYWSEVYSFKTGPSEEDAPFEILLISDPQGFTAGAYEKVGKLLSASESVFSDGYDFIVNGGDLVEYSKNTSQYHYYLDVLRPYLANTTQVVVAGNHDQAFFEMKEEYLPFVSSGEVYLEEYNYMLMNFNFNLPSQDTRDGAYYSYDYSGVHFTVINSNACNEKGLFDSQLKWIEEDLSNTTKKHKVVIMHKSLYSAGPHSKEAEIISMREQLGPIFEDYGVNLVVSGHDHSYSETYYLNSDGSINRAANNKSRKIGGKGTLFVNLGTVGNKYYKYDPNTDVPIYTGAELHDPYLSNSTFGKLTFDGKNLFYQGYQYDLDADKIIAIKPPLKTLDIVLISVGSAVGAAGIGVGIFFLIKYLKKKKAV